MSVMIFDNAGNAVESFDNERDACVALIAMAKADSGTVREMAILAFDDEGEAVGEPLTVADVEPELATQLVMRGSWDQCGTTLFKAWPRGVVVPSAVAGAL